VRSSPQTGDIDSRHASLRTRGASTNVPGY
jgi:hypothetical protein